MNQPLRVLIAEDNPADAKLVLRELRQAGFEPEWQRVDTEAAFLSQLHANWDIILSDYMMPEFGRPRALELLKQSGLDIPFIIISGTIGEEVAVGVMKLGAADYLLKDRLARLGQAVSQALEQSRLRRERRAADTALRESEERFREAVENIEEVFWMTNFDRSQMLFISSAYEKIWGRTCESLRASPRSWLDAILPEDRDRVERAATSRPGFYEFTEEYRIARPDGSVRWISDRAFPVRNAAGEVYRFAGVAIDITERKCAEEAQRESEKQLALITDNVPGLISYIDADLRYRFVNVAYEKMFHLPRAQLLGKSVREVIGDEAFSRVEPNARRALANERVTFENSLAGPSGQPLHFMVTYVPDTAPDGSVKGLFTLVTDVTLLKRAEEELRKSEDRLRQSQKMEAIGQLAGGVAHDFNNRLTIMLGYANILAEKLEEPNLRRFANNICITAQRSAELTQKLLVFARKGETQTAPVDLHKILTETIEMLERAVDKRIVLRQEFFADSAVLIGIGTQLQDALLNLGINARDAMPDGGTLTYRTENVALDAALCARLQNDVVPGEYLKLTVIDTGTGMSDEVKKHIFEPFFTTKPVGKGTGLGLASVFGTVKKHAGAVNVDSSLGQGTRFTIFLPLAEHSAPQTAVESGTACAVKPLKILVVEDEEIIRTMTVYILRENGHEVFEAENGREAVAFYKNHWQTIDLVMLDMIMPEMNGHDTFLAMKGINPAIKAILATGYSLNNEVQAVLDDGVLDFVQKPFHPVELQKTIAKVIMK